MKILLSFLLTFALTVYAQDPSAPVNGSPQSATTGIVHDATDDLFLLETEPPVIHLEDENRSVAPTPSPTVDLIEKIRIESTGKGQVQIFRLANEAYEKESFEEAIALYRVLVDRGIHNGDLFYNLANAYFRTGNFGQAILFYEKARRLRPRDIDIAHNLSYTRTFLIDKETKSDTLPGSLETLLILHRKTTLNETLWILAILSWIFASILLLRSLRLKFTESVFWGYLKGVFLILFVLQIVSAGVKIWVEQPIREGVILEDSVSVAAAPKSEKQLVELNSGTTVRILDIRDGYAHIRLSDGVPGFIEEEKIGEI